MLATSITIKNLDYEKTLEGIFPLLKEKIAKKESSHMVIQLFKKLDDASLSIALNIMNRMSEEAKTELMVTLLNTYSGKIRDKLNEKLVLHNIGRHLKVGSVYIIQQNNVLYLCIGQIRADYGKLLRELSPEGLGGLGDLLGHLVGERTERKVLKLLWSENNKQRALELARNTLTQYGIVAELDDIQLITDNVEQQDAIEGVSQLQLTDEMEMQIIDALAGYLKDSVEDPCCNEEIV